jgi:hypothetical protein
VADLHQRAEVSRAATERHLTALAAVHVQIPLAEEAAQVCRPVHRHRRRYRALNPFGEAAQLLTVVNRGDFALNGFRNRDVRARLYTEPEYCDLRAVAPIAFLVPEEKNAPVVPGGNFCLTSGAVAELNI